MKTLIKSEKIQKREVKVAKLEWRGEMRHLYGEWTKRKSSRIVEGQRRFGSLKFA